MRAKDAVGRYGEDVAVRHLREHGLEVLDRNWRSRTGELDIVAREGRTIVFVEVKTRSSVDYGVPAEAVTLRKARRIHVLAHEWLAETGHRYGDLRFDVISVLRPRRGATLVEHLRGAF